jgi:hypothetical protein
MLQMLSDDGAVWMAGRPGTSGALQNSQCAVTLGSSSVVANGNTLTLNLAMTFPSRYAGPKNVYMYAQNAQGVSSGWQTRGTWTVTGSETGPGVPPAGGATSVTADSATPNSGSGASQTFALRYSDTLGVSNLATAWVWFNETLGSVSSNSCLLYYDRPGAALYLLNDDATVWMPGRLGSGATLQNSLCAVNVGGSSATVSGNSLTLNLAMTFKAAYAGAKNIYMFAQNAGGVNTGWQTRGTWTVPGTPAAGAPAVTADSATPNSGSGASQTFALRSSDTRGAANLQTAWVWFNETFASVSSNSCMLYYDRAAATLYLLNDSASVWMPGRLGSSGTLQNSRCSVRLGSSSVTASGNTLTLNLAMTFRSAFAGQKNIYMWTQNASGINSGWQTRGTWMVP